MNRRLKIGLLSLASTLVALEIGLRFAYPVGKRTYIEHPVYLHTTIPGSRRIQPMPKWAGGARNLVEIGPEGFRGPGLDQPKTRHRIAVVGDSFVMSENVAFEETFPERLAHYLEGDVEAVNVGASGHGPDQSLMRLEESWDVLQPDEVVLVLCATNDFGDVVRNKLVRQNERGAAIRTRPLLSDDAKQVFIDSKERSNQLALIRLYQAWRKGIDEAEDDGPRPTGLIELYLEAGLNEWRDYDSADLTVHDLFRDYYDADIAVDPDSESSRGKLEAMDAVMNEWRAFIKEREVPFTVVVVPSAVDLDPTFHIRVDPGRHPGYDPRRLSGRLAKAASGGWVPVFDLYELFATHEPATLFVGHQDTHWNAKGIDLAAEFLAGAMRD